MSSGDKMHSRTGLAASRPAVTIAVELVVGFALICGTQFLVFGNLALSTYPLHPFWPLVILVSVQYGAGPGMITASLAAIMKIACEPWLLSRATDLSSLENVIADPALWLLAAVVIGGYRDRDNARIQSLVRDLKQERHRVQTLSDLSLQLKARLETMQVEALTGPPHAPAHPDRAPQSGGSKIPKGRKKTVRAR